MHPELFRIGNFVVSSFGAMLVVAFIAAYFQLSWGLRRVGVGDEEDASAVLVAAIVGGIVGAKVYYALLYHDWRLLFDRSGLVWYGGFLLGTAAVLWVLKRRRLSFWGTLDAASPALALGYGLGRVGCFLVGDDYGIPTSLPWGVRFGQGLPPSTVANLRDQFGVAVPGGLAPSTVLRVHPTQLYETALGLVIWGVGVALLRRGVGRGTTALTVLALLACERFGIEFLRAKDDRFVGTLTLAQVISIAVLAIVLAVAWWRRSHSAEAAAAGSASR